jgi:hypothetical protein
MINLQKSICLLLMAFLTSLMSAQTLTVQEQKGKFGYVDESGKFIIKASYDHAYPFDGETAKVCKGDKWGYIDKQGKAVIPLQYESIEEFSNGIALVKKNKKYGYITRDGKDYIKPDYDFIGSFNEQGYIWVGKGKTLAASLKGLYRYDKLIIQPKEPYLGFYVATDSTDYTNGAPIPTKNSVPTNNEIKSNFCKLSSPGSDYIWTANASGLPSVYDIDGKLLIKTQKGALGMPHDGYSIIRTFSISKKVQYYNFNYIATDGKATKLFKKDIQQEIDLDNIYDACTPFYEGKAQCGTGSISYLVDTNGNSASPLYDKLQLVQNKGYISTTGGKYGLLSLEGKEIVKPSYEIILPPYEGENIMAAKNASGKSGFLDFNGNEVIPFKYDVAYTFTDGRAIVAENNLCGMVDNTGNYIVANRWEAILPTKGKGNDFVWVKSPDSHKWQTLQISKDALSFEQAFDEVSAYDSKGRALVQEGEQFGAVASDGTAVLPLNFNDATIARKALAYIDENGKSTMEEIDAYRFNIYNNPQRHKFRISETISDNMWDF